MDWAQQADSLLYDGETVTERVAVGDGGVVVTSHRVLAFRPDREGANYRQADRPNVEGATCRTSGEFGFLQQAIKALVVGAVLVVAGLTVDLGGLVSGISFDSGGAASAVGIGGLLGPLQTMLGLLAKLDYFMRVFGVLALAFGVVVLAVYVWSRERRLVIDVAGDDDIELTAPNDDAVLEQVQAALVPGDAPPDAVGDDAGA